MGFDGEGFMKRFMGAWNAHDVDAIMALMTDDCVFEPSFGPDPWGVRYRGEELGHLVGDDHAVVEWVTTGTPADGKPFTVHGCDILTLRNGKISAKRSYRKATL